ncbi:MAG: hypothetical protein ABIH21_04080 [Patescibacteria group bacterium]
MRNTIRLFLVMLIASCARSQTAPQGYEGMDELYDAQADGWFLSHNRDRQEDGSAIHSHVYVKSDRSQVQCFMEQECMQKHIEASESGGKGDGDDMDCVDYNTCIPYIVQGSVQPPSSAFSTMDQEQLEHFYTEEIDAFMMSHCSSEGVFGGRIHFHEYQKLDGSWILCSMDNECFEDVDVANCGDRGDEHCVEYSSCRPAAPADTKKHECDFVLRDPPESMQ